MLCYDFSYFLPPKNCHITYYTQSTVCQGGFHERISSHKFFSSSPWAYAVFAKGDQLFGGFGRVA